MKRILHAILSALLHATARLPFWMLYGISDFLFIVICYVVCYRKKVVLKNLRESFPEKSDKEVRRIARQFYRNFTDYIVETIKLLHITDEEMKKRMEFVGIDIVDNLFRSNKSIAAYFSHCFNWEWVPSITLWTEHPLCHDDHREGIAFCQVYRPLKDKWFDSLMLKVRSRFNAISIPKAHTLRQLITFRNEGILSITGFMSDQKPSHGDPTEVVRFLNHPTAMITGTETLARRLDMAAVYFDMEKLKRGHYRVTIRKIGEDLSVFPPMGITDKYAQLLQATIMRSPAIWLWTHKRWKIPVQMP